MTRLTRLGLALGLAACGLPDPQGFTTEGARQYWGVPCNPAELTACGRLQLVAGGWCEPADRGVPAQCVVPCGDLCDEWGGICTPEGSCYAKP